MLVDRQIPSHITGLYIFTVLNLFVLLNVTLVSGDITVVDTSLNETIELFEDMEGTFGPGLPVEGIWGHLVYVQPHNACQPVEPPPSNEGEFALAWIALIARDGCEFAQKVLAVQRAGYVLAIIHNNVGDDHIFPMKGDGPDIRIPSVFVGWTSGHTLATKYNYKKRQFVVHVESVVPIDYKIYLWPFAIVIGTCFCLMVVFIIAKWCRDMRIRQRSRLSKKHLKKIPIKKFKKGDHYDVCAICLDDYEEGDKMRVLPCSHAYHVKCVDPWLLKNKKTCPVCKRRVIPGRDLDSDSDSDEENGNSPTENTPLLGSQGRSGPSRRSTFENSGLPEGVREEATLARQAVETAVAQTGDQDTASIGSEDGAVGGVVQSSVEVVVESDNTLNVNTNYGFDSDDSDVAVAGEKGSDKKSKELNQVV